MSELKEPCSAKTPIRAAAVCYRRGVGGVEFLLVRTKYVQGWTFPKGQVEPGENLAQAAAREAEEEAGAVGSVDSLPVGTYRYPMGRREEPAWEVCVEAYLLEAVRLGPPDAAEGMRDPSWFAPEAAIARLAIDRDADHALEHRRVIEAALRRLQP